jgi:hypothetical protein
MLVAVERISAVFSVGCYAAHASAAGHGVGRKSAETLLRQVSMSATRRISRAMIGSRA